MPGPAPKHPDARVRRNAAPETTKLAVGPAARDVPRCPTGLRPRTRRWWVTIWSSPMAVLYVDADVPALERLAELLDRREPKSKFGVAIATELAEIRNMEDRFGLTPLARRRLQWELDLARDGEAARLAAAAEAAARAAGEDGPAAATGTDDPARFMRAIQGGKS